MGLLDQYAPQQQAPQGGMGGMMGGAPMAQQGGNAGLQMAQALAANPTPQMAMQVVQQMKQAGMPEADQVAQALQQMGDDPAVIKQFADQVVQALSAQ